MLVSDGWKTWLVAEAWTVVIVVAGPHGVSPDLVWTQPYNSCFWTVENRSHCGQKWPAVWTKPKRWICVWEEQHTWPQVSCLKVKVNVFSVGSHVCFIMDTTTARYVTGNQKLEHQNSLKSISAKFSPWELLWIPSISLMTFHMCYTAGLGWDKH